MPTDLDLVQAAQLALAFKHRAEGNKDDADKIIIEKLYEHPELSLFRRAKGIRPPSPLVVLLTLHSQSTNTSSSSPRTSVSVSSSPATVLSC